MSLSECKGCGQRVLWTLTPAGARAPVDYAPSPSGTVLVIQPSNLGELLSVVLTGDTLRRAQARQIELRTAHWATCPNAEEFRRQRA